MTALLPLIAAVLAAVASFMLAQYGLGRWGSLVTLSGGESASAEGSWQARLTTHTQRVLPERLRADLARQIRMAGGLAGLTPAQMSLYAISAALAGLAIGSLWVLVTGWSAAFVLAATVLGAVLPFIWLRDRVRGRHARILEDLPYHLDMLTLCVEAGVDFGAACARIVEKGRAGPLQEEFNMFLAELRVGKTRSEALQDMAERVGLDALSVFLAALVQADRLGSGLGKTLRLQAEQTRAERFQRAETRANQAPVKMLLPLVLFIFPTIWIILGAPLIFEWVFRGVP